MMHHLLGEEGFRRGMDLYFQRHDGQAVTCDDFVAALADANGTDLAQFRRWYSQAGTPELRVMRHYDPASRCYTLTVRQSCPPTPQQPVKAPFHIPLAVGLLDRQGRDLALQLAGENAPAEGATRVLEVREPEQTFRFVNVAQEPVPSVLRGFSAPVKLYLDYSDAELMFLLAHDSDDFNRWEASQQLMLRTIFRLLQDKEQAGLWELPLPLIEAFRNALHAAIDPALRAQVLTLPSETYLAEQMDIVDVDGLHAARNFVRRALAVALRDDFLAVYQRSHERGPVRIDAAAAGQRALKNACLDYLLQLTEPQLLALCLAQFRDAANMTDQLTALALLANREGPEREAAFAAFYQRFAPDALVVDKWFALQASSQLPDTLTRIKALLHHPAYNGKNPNKVRALIGTFSRANPVRFHAADGSGYVFLADQALALNALNPQVAARLLGAFTRWRKYDANRQALMRGQLERILAAPALSSDVFEIVSKSLSN
jgi:aminopeptidase N